MSCHRFKMLTRWLTFTAFLANSADQQRAAVGQGSLSVAPTCKVKGHPEVQLTLNCGDGKNAGVVQYWYTPFGELQTSGFYSELDPVFMHHDGSLVIANSSFLHSGLYYCLLRQIEGATLWPYELHIGQNHQKIQEHSEYEQSSSCAILRFRRDIVPEREMQASNEEFAGAVAASVLLTFVLGFSAGALSRAHVLRCLGALTTRLRSPQQQTDTADRDSEVTMTTVPPMYQAFEMGQVRDDDSVNCTSRDTTISSTASFAPAKPQRSFRHKREEQQEIAAHLEGCDYMKEEEQRAEEEEEEAAAAGSGVKEKNQVCERGVEKPEKGEREFSSSYLLGEDGESQRETDKDKCSEDGEEKDAGENKEEKKEFKQEEPGEQANKSKEDGEERRESKEEAECNKEKARDEQREKEEGWKEENKGENGEKKGGEDNTCGDSKELTETETEEDETGSTTQEDTRKHGIVETGEAGAPSSPPCPARRTRIIRLYQYDEVGQRYCHLPDPTPDDSDLRPRQRSVSLTRLNTIMAAASAGPLDKRETGREERGDRPHFHMDI